MAIYPKHIPNHLYFDNATYFVCARTVDKNKYFYDVIRRKILRRRIKDCVKKYGIELIAWATLQNHYHVMFLLKNGKLLTDIERFINGGSAFELNTMDGARGRNVWWNYWDYCIRNEVDYWKHFNYINLNPIKHGLVKNLDRLKNSKDCSYRDYYLKYGSEWMKERLKKYPVKDFSVDDDA